MTSQAPPMPEHAPPAAPSAPLYHQPTLGVPLKGLNHQVPPNTWLDTDGRTNGRTNRGTDGWTQATCHIQDECVRYCLLSLRRCIQCVLYCVRYIRTELRTAQMLALTCTRAQIIMMLLIITMLMLLTFAQIMKGRTHACPPACPHARTYRHGRTCARLCTQYSIKVGLERGSA